jgi:MFS family permease
VSFSAGFQPIVNAFRNPNYGIYTLGSGVSLIGTWMQRIAVGWLTWQLTESGTWLGLIAFANLFPTVVIAPFAGVVADRWRRLTVIKISQSLGPGPGAHAVRADRERFDPNRRHCYAARDRDVGRISDRRGQ